MLIKYSYKNKAKNYQDTEESKLVLPNIRQRLHYQLTYSPLSVLRWKTVVEYVRSEVWKREASNGWALGSSMKVGYSFALSLRTSLSGVWFSYAGLCIASVYVRTRAVVCVFYDVLVWKGRAMGLDNGL